MINPNLVASFNRIFYRSRTLLPRLVWLVAMQMLVNGYLHSDELAINGGVSSDRILHGISQSGGEPSIQLSLDWSQQNGVYLGANISWGETVELPKRNQTLHGYAGYFLPINEQSAVEFSVSFYGYNADFEKSWNYSEFGADYHIGKSFNLGIDYTDNYYALGNARYYWHADWQPEIVEDLYLQLSVGNTKITEARYLDNWTNYQLVLIKTVHRWSYLLGYYYADRAAEYIQGEDTAGERIALSVSYRFY